MITQPIGIYRKSHFILEPTIDKIKANGELKKIYDKWMKVPVPEFPKSLEGIPFTAG